MIPEMQMNKVLESANRDLRLSESLDVCLLKEKRSNA